MAEIIFEAEAICKNFGSTVALNNYSFNIKRGEIHGLVGENGSGKSTMASIAAGIHKATSGSMKYMGKSWKPNTTLEAQAAGIGMIVQEMGTIESLTVAQNIFLGYEKEFRKGVLIDVKKMNLAAKKALDILELDEIYPEMPTRLLSMQDRKLVEIAKVLYRKPELLIVDETTTVLSHSGREKLYKQMLRMKSDGKAVLIISHDLGEIMEYCDVLSVLRDGKGIIDIDRKDFDENHIKNSMIGRELSGDYYRSDNDGYSDEIVLKAERITDLKAIMNVSIDLHKGEILGIGGLSECGIHELGKALFGAEEVLTGKVTLPQQDTEIKDCITAVSNGIAYMSKDRDKESLALTSPIYNNIASTGYKKNSWYNILNYKKEKKYVMDQQTFLSIKCRDVNQEVKALSGGNKQKVVFGKWMAADSDIYIMDCPTRGVDVGVKAAMYQIMKEIKDAGKSIIMISEEMPELIGMSDRILIMKNGEINGEFLRTDGYSENKLIEVMI